MELKTLSIPQMRDIYYSYLVNDFPPAERVPFSRMESMMKKEIYSAFGIYYSGNLVGYVTFVSYLSRSVVLCDYLSILKEYRSNGYGSDALGAISEKLRDIDYILVEVEDPDFTEQEEHRLLMQRRIGFYLRNGACLTDVRAVTFGVHYRIICIPHHRMPDNREMSEVYQKIYDLRVTPLIRRLRVRVFSESAVP